MDTIIVGFLTFTLFQYVVAQVCQTLSNGMLFTVSVTSSTEGSIATYTCITGYTVGYSRVTTSTRTCTDGVWTGQEPKCTPVECGNLYYPANGLVSLVYSKYQGTGLFICNTGYDVTGTSSNTVTVTCTSSGTWSKTGITCTKKDCGNLNIPANGQVSVSNSQYQGTAQYTCNTGYDVTGTSSNTVTVTCTSSGTWSQTGITCTIKADPLGATCPNPSSTNLLPGDLCTGDNASCLRRSSTSQDYTCQCSTGYYDDNGNQPAGQCRTISELEVFSITFTSVTTTGMIVFWTPPTNKENFISGYSVEWRPKDNSVAGSSSQNLITTSSYTISNNVMSGKAYTVKVISQNKVDYTETVQTTFNQKEQALKPQRPGPINTASSNLDARDQTIDLVWTASSGHVWYYQVELFDVGGQTALKTVTSYNSTVNLNYGQMKNGHRYDVSITALSQMFDGTKTLTSDRRREVIKTVVQVPSVPRSVQCQMVTDSSVTIKWQASTNPNGDLVGYKIDTYLLGSSDTLKTENKTENIADVSQTFEVGGLSPGSNYYFNVFTINEGYISSAARLTENSCETRASMVGPPNNLVISSVQSRNFTVSWTRPTNMPGEHRGYVIQVRLLNDTCVKQLVIKCTGCSGTFDESSLGNMCSQSISITELLDTSNISSTAPISRQFTELDPDTNYNVIISAVDAEGRGNTADQNQRTEEEFPQKPKNVTISNLSPTSCTVTWDIDSPRPGNTTYTVNVVAVLPVTPNNHLLLGFNSRTQALTGLQEYWNYSVIIRAETSKGNVESDPYTFRTLPAAPGPVENFYIIFHPNFDFTKLSVEWKVPALLERNSVIDRFLLFHNVSENMDDRMISFLKNDDDLFKYTHTFNITPKVYYQFKVFAVNTDNQDGIESVRTLMAPAKEDDATKEASNIVVVVAAVIVPTVVIATIVTVVIVIYRQRSAQQVDSRKSRVETQSREWKERMSVKTSSTQSTELTSNMTNKEVLEWLKDNNLYKFKTHFKEYTGHDMLKLSKEDLKSICGAADGIRMYNRLRESTADYNISEREQAYMDLDDTKRDGVPYENIEMDRTHMYSSLQHV